MRHRFVKYLGMILCVISISGLVFFPTAGFARYAVKNTQNLVYYIPKGQWDVFRWLQNNTEKDAVVLAIDWNDVYLVPAYTHDNLFFGHYILENRTEKNEVVRYLTAWHLLGLPRRDLERLVVDSVSSYRLLGVDYLGNLEFPSRKAHESALFIHGLIYYPYLVKFDGKMLGTPDFTIHIMNSYDKIDWKEMIETIPCDYILISDFYWDRALSLNDTNRFELLYSNDIRRIYKLIPPHSS
jgi:hypothetical protein